MKIEEIILEIIKGDQKTLSNILQLLNIIKGDSNTISNISSLLQLLKDYKKPNQEKKESPKQKVQEKVVQKPQQKQVRYDEDRPEDFASAVLEAHYKSGGVLKGKSNFNMSNFKQEPIEKLVQDGKITKEEAAEMDYLEMLM